MYFRDLLKYAVMWGRVCLVVCVSAMAVSGCAPALGASQTKAATPPPVTVPPVAVLPTASPAATATVFLPPTPTATATTTATRPPVPSPTATSTATATPGPTPDGRARTVRVPILMYHYISEPPAGADVYRQDLSVAPARFAEHLDYLLTAGYHVIALDDLLYALALGWDLPAKPVILTFDDGYEDNYTEAFPRLRERGLVAHFFIITDFVNEARPGYMTWPQIEEMAAAGQRFGSHSRDHPDLSGRDTDYLVWQALGSKEAIETHLGYHPRWVVYPAGKYDAQVIAVFHSAHYWGGLTTQQGATHTLADIFELRRVRIRGAHTTEDLARLLALAW